MVETMREVNFTQDKLGGPGFIVKVDETMLNYKLKSHRGRLATNRTDAIYIVEFNCRIVRAFAQVILNKTAATLVLIICQQVANNSEILTDENRAYLSLRNFKYIHETVCHKYEFVDSDSVVNAQAVESFYN